MTTGMILEGVVLDVRFEELFDGEVMVLVVLVVVEFLTEEVLLVERLFVGVVWTTGELCTCSKSKTEFKRMDLRNMIVNVYR